MKHERRPPRENPPRLEFFRAAEGDLKTTSAAFSSAAEILLPEGGVDECMCCCLISIWELYLLEREVDRFMLVPDVGRLAAVMLLRRDVLRSSWEGRTRLGLIILLPGVVTTTEIGRWLW